MEAEEFQKLYESVGGIDIASIEFDEESMEHSGILGQRWGKRRFQNDDGTYTELGKERRRKFGGMSRAEKKAAKKAKKKADDARTFREVKKVAVKRGDIKFAEKHFDQLTEDEIEELYSRYNMKQRIDRLSAEKTQETLDKWVNRLDSAGRMARSVDSIYTSLNNMSETSKNAKAADSRRKIEAKKGKLSLEEQELRNDSQRIRNKVDKENYDRMKEETKEYRDKMREYELEKARLINVNQEANANKLNMETRNAKEKGDMAYYDWKYDYDKKTKPAKVVDPYSQKTYSEEVKAARKSITETIDAKIAEKYKYYDDKAADKERKYIKNDLKKQYIDMGYSEKSADLAVRLRLEQFDDQVKVDKANGKEARANALKKFDNAMPESYKEYLNKGGTPLTSSKEKDNLKGASKDIKEMKEEIKELKKTVYDEI